MPTPEAQDIFEQINGVYKKVDDLHFTLSRIERGAGIELRIGSVPSISHVMVPRAIERLRAQHPDLRLDINILKIEEAVDYILLGKGELAVMSYKLDHPAWISCRSRAGNSSASCRRTTRWRKGRRSAPATWCATP